MMIYKKLGSTGMMVSRIGFGGIPILQASNEQAEKVLQRAFEKGINFIDTHRRYGDSEIKIGRALSSVREQVYLSTKIADHTRAGAEKSLKQSLKRLKTKYIDLLLIKNLDSEEVLSQAIGRNGSLKVARQAQKAGIVRHIGMTSHNEKITYKALRTGEFEAVMYPYNIVNLSAERRIFRYCNNHNIGYICMKPVAGGLLTVPSKVFAKMTRGKANTTASAAMRFCLSHPTVSTVIPGLDKIKYLNEALSAIKEPMDQKERDLAQKKVAKLGQGFCRNCGYCKPCPQQIDINNIFRFYHYYKSYDLKLYAQQHYKKLKIKADKCEKCGLCLSRCPYNINIPEKLTTAHKKLSLSG